MRFAADRGWIEGSAFIARQPSWLFAEYSLIPGIYAAKYKPAIDALLGVDNRHEFMMKMPFVMQRRAIGSLRERVVGVHASRLAMTGSKHGSKQHGQHLRQGHPPGVSSDYHVFENAVRHALYSIDSHNAALSNFNLKGAYTYAFANTSVPWVPAHEAHEKLASLAH
eukprot:3874532-Prymnesium_polylepis.1